MGRSIDYLKTIEPLKDYFQTDAEMLEENITEFVGKLLEHNKELLNYDLDGGMYSWWLNKDIVLKAKYAPKAEFENYFISTLRCDGTFVFFAEVINNAVANMLAGQIPKKYSDKIVANVPIEITYYIGNAVVVSEYGDFGTEDKPWMKSRFTAFLPFKVEVKPQERKLIV